MSGEQTAGLSPEELADQVRGDRIDVLVDLVMHMALNRVVDICAKAGAGSGRMAGVSGRHGYGHNGLSAHRSLSRSAGS